MSNKPPAAAKLRMYFSGRSWTALF